MVMGNDVNPGRKNKEKICFLTNHWLVIIALRCSNENLFYDVSKNKKILINMLNKERCTFYFYYIIYITSNSCEMELFYK